MSTLTDPYVYIVAYWSSPTSEKDAKISDARYAAGFLEQRLTEFGAHDERIICSHTVEESPEKQTLYPVVGEPNWQKVRSDPSIETCNWVFRVHDVTGALFGVHKQGTAGVADLRELGARMRPEATGGAAYIGGAYLYVARTDPRENPTSKAIELFGVGPDLPPSEICYEGVEQPVSIFRFDTDNPRWENLAVFLPLDESVDRQITRLLNEIIPDVLRSLFKIRHLFRQQFAAICIELADVERELLSHEIVMLSPWEAEAQLDVLTSCFRRFSSSLARLHRIRWSLTVNYQNLLMTLDQIQRSGPFGWFQKVKTAGNAAVRQVRADIGYFEIRTRECEVALSAFKTQIEILRLQVEAAEETFRERVNMYIAVVGIALAGLTAFDSGTVKAIVESMLDLPIADTSDGSVFVFLVRCLIVSLITAAMVGIRSVLSRSRRSHKREPA